MSLPHVKHPCKECPFRTTAQKGWLGENRMKSILDARTFTCHKKRHLQCAGHMLMKNEDNDFVMLANRLKIPLDLSGKEHLFDNEAQCIEHHA